MPKGNQFHSARFFEIPKGWIPDPQKLQAAPFVPTGPTQELSFGFIPPRGGRDPGDWPYVEVINGLHIIRFCSQTRAVPKSAINAEVAKVAEAIKKETGRVPGKKQTKQLKDDARQTLLPRAFTRDAETWALVCPQRGLLVVNTSSPSVRLPQELVATHTVNPGELTASGLVANIYVRPMRTAVSFDAFMNDALTDPDKVHPFGPATSCVLSAKDESRRQVSFKNHELHGNEHVLKHLRMGHSPVSLGLYLASQAHFEIDDAGGLKKITLKDDLLGQDAAPGDGDQDAFDADFVFIGAGLLQIYDELALLLKLERREDEQGPSIF